MKKQLRSFVLLFGLLNTCRLSAQTLSPRLDSIGKSITGALAGYYKKYPQEKIFIHTDQNIYLSGQTIWYKAYAMAYGKPSQLSKIVYLRLSDARGNMIKQHNLPVKNGTASGDMAIPDSLRTGWYHLQAFTAWMLNFDGDGLYHQNIYIQNPRDKNDSPPVMAKGKAYHINFYPEGGDLVDNNVSNIAFKAVDETGMPVKIYGDVIDSSKKSPAKLITVHDGMGSLQLQTYAADSYVARVRFPDNSLQMVALPAVKKTGISMEVNTMPADELVVKIVCAGQTQELQDIIVEAVQNNGTSVCYPLQISRGINIFGIKKNNFLSGVLRLTVFGASGLPKAERVVFVDNNDRLKLTIARDSLSVSPKGDNAFTIDLKDRQGNPAKANLSVAITDEAIGAAPDENISSYFLLGSELHGSIHQPDYYFKNESDTLRQQLDLVMLTNGWRHFKWNEIINAGPKTLKYYVEQSKLLAGKVANYHSGDKWKVKLMITNSDSGKSMGYAEPDSTGYFAFKDYNGRGAATVYYEVVDNNNKKLPAKVDFIKPAIDTLQLANAVIDDGTGTSQPIVNAYLDAAIREQNSRYPSKGIMLKTVQINERQQTPTELLIKEKVKHLSSDGAFTLDLVNTPSLPTTTIFPYIQGRFPGLDVYPSDGGLSAVFKYHGWSTLLHNDSTASGNSTDLPYFYVDEAQVNIGDVAEMSLTDVALIQFAPPTVWFAPLGGGANGALLIYTRQYGDDKNVVRRKGNFDQYIFNGYSITREFQTEEISPKQPDYRTTLYWAHDLNTDDKGNVKIHFTKSDRVKKYRLVVQGMDADGKTAYFCGEIAP